MTALLAQPAPSHVAPKRPADVRHAPRARSSAPVGPQQPTRWTARAALVPVNLAPTFVNEGAPQHEADTVRVVRLADPAPRYEWTSRGLAVMLAMVALVVVAMTTTLVSSFLAVSDAPISGQVAAAGIVAEAAIGR